MTSRRSRRETFGPRMKSLWLKISADYSVVAGSVAIDNLTSDAQANLPTLAAGFTLAGGFLSITLDTNGNNNGLPATIAVGVFNSAATGTSELPNPNSESQNFPWHYIWHRQNPPLGLEARQYDLAIKTMRKLKAFENYLLWFDVPGELAATTSLSIRGRLLAKY